MLRAISLEGIGTTLELSKVRSVKIQTRFVHLDCRDDGTWCLTYNGYMIPDFTQVIAFTFKPKAVEVDGLDLELPLAKSAKVGGTAKMIHMEELPDGKWRLIYSGEVIPDISKLSALRIIRED